MANRARRLNRRDIGVIVTAAVRDYIARNIGDKAVRPVAIAALGLTASERRSILQLLDFVAMISESEIDCHVKRPGKVTPFDRQRPGDSRIVRRARKRWRLAQDMMLRLEGHA